MVSRVEFSKKVRAEAFARANGCCKKCQARLKAGEGEYDHIVAFWLTQDSSLENCQVLCVPCHRGVGAKTADDQKMISKVKRIKAKHDGTWVRKGPKIQSRGFK